MSQRRLGKHQIDDGDIAGADLLAAILHARDLRTAHADAISHVFLAEPKLGARFKENVHAANSA